MTRFDKEMRKHFAKAFQPRPDQDETGAYCVPENALIVFYSPSLVTILEYQRDGKQREVTNDYPRISAPYLVYLCGGDEEKAKQILKEQSKF